MDAFEARGQFSKLLRRLNAGTRSQEVGVQFLRDNSDLINDLFRCILEELAKVSINQRVNILYFLAFVAATPSQRLASFKTLISQNISDIVNRAVPPNIPGIVNAEHAFAVLDSLVASKTVDTVTAELTKEQIRTKRQVARTNYQHASTPDPKATAPMTREAILRRMEDDRERYKKAKERHTAVDPEDPVEFQEYWGVLGPLNDLDYERMAEQNEIALRSRRGLF